eukprot:1141358-Pelagomonas_calceolata.AAC.7
MHGPCDHGQIGKHRVSCHPRHCMLAAGCCTICIHVRVFMPAKTVGSNRYGERACLNTFYGSPLNKLNSLKLIKSITGCPHEWTPPSHAKLSHLMFQLDLGKFMCLACFVPADMVKSTLFFTQAIVWPLLNFVRSTMLDSIQGCALDGCHGMQRWRSDVTFCIGLHHRPDESPHQHAPPCKGACWRHGQLSKTGGRGLFVRATLKQERQAKASASAEHSHRCQSLATAEMNSQSSISLKTGQRARSSAFGTWQKPEGHSFD